jgi:predicted AAA+ superfamily ATPase
MLFLARKHNRKLFNTISLPFIEQHTPQYTPTTFNERYLNYDFIYPYYQQNKVLAIKSPYGTGKTQFLAKLFEQLPTDKSILFITPRVSLSYTQLKSFPHFYHYQNKTLTEITNAKQLIIQLDSIYKLDNTNTTNKILINNSKLFAKYQTPKEQPTDTHIKYDIIALDEIESLLYHLSFNKINNFISNQTPPKFPLISKILPNQSQMN